MFLGTSSGAGKTTMAAVYCRHLASKGVRTAPFKASNLSLNSYATSEGGEIGMGQAFQAWACGAEPSVEMNPVLLKPSGGRMQVILRGRPFAEASVGQDPDTEMMAAEAFRAFDSLSSRYDAVVCEGSGSPAEINLLDRDIANMRMVRERGIPAVLVADIERGGVFAVIYGTWRLIPEEDRHLLRGFIINRFRGDPSLLRSGIERMEELTGMKCLGVMPYADLRFPEEDSLSEGRGQAGGRGPAREHHGQPGRAAGDRQGIAGHEGAGQDRRRMIIRRRPRGSP
jgi:adenosylcobyric acid synthase